MIRYQKSSSVRNWEIYVRRYSELINQSQTIPDLSIGSFVTCVNKSHSLVFCDLFYLISPTWKVCLGNYLISQTTQWIVDTGRSWTWIWPYGDLGREWARNAPNLMLWLFCIVAPLHLILEWKRSSLARCTICDISGYNLLSCFKKKLYQEVGIFA